MPARYRHTQIGYLMIAMLGAVTLAVWYTGGASPRGGVLAILLMLWVVLFWFSTLTTVVADGVFQVFFGPGLIRRRIDVRDIREVRVVRNPWYCGWGIRWIGRGWLWNVSGFRAVELELPNGRRFRVGSDKPETLAEALRQG